MSERMLGRIWDRCAVCDEAVALVAGVWHHAGPADHAAASTAVLLSFFDALDVLEIGAE